MSSLRRDLTDAQWALLDPLIPEPQRRKDGRGRPWRDRREVLSGIKRGKGTKIMAGADSTGLPISVHVESATPHEVTLVQDTLARGFVDEPLARLIGDNAYDSDRLDEELADNGVEMIAPHRSK
jgi:hypothetical protein